MTDEGKGKMIKTTILTLIAVGSMLRVVFVTVKPIATGISRGLNFILPQHAVAGDPERDRAQRLLYEMMFEKDKKQTVKRGVSE